MKIDILTLFPNMFDGFLNESIIKRAIQNKKVEINIYDIREYSTDPHKKVDDYGIGGGAGMVLMPQPIFDAVDNLKTDDCKIILMTPQGQKYDQEKAYALTNEKHLIIICGHYEGFDERIRSLADFEISIGDYVLTGGEIPSMAITDSIVRLLDGVIEKESHINDSFHDNLLDYPVYTKPLNFRGMEVPDILLTGHHENINKWRYERQLEKTKERRPDLIDKGDDTVKEQKYVIMKNYFFRDIKSLDYNKLEGFHFKPSNSITYAGVTVNHMVMIKPNLVEKVLKRKIKKRLEVYLRFIISIIDSDDDSDITGLRAALNDLSKYKETIRYKYQQYLDEKYTKLLFEKIELLEKELKKKIMNLKEPEEIEMNISRRR